MSKNNSERVSGWTEGRKEGAEAIHPVLQLIHISSPSSSSSSSLSPSVATHLHRNGPRTEDGGKHGMEADRPAADNGEGQRPAGRAHGPRTRRSGPKEWRKGNDGWVRTNCALLTRSLARSSTHSHSCVRPRHPRTTRTLYRHHVRRFAGPKQV